jgi:hypothetical protein
MKGFEEIYDEVISVAENGGPFVRVGEFRLERHLAEALERRSWLEQMENEAALLHSPEAWEDELLDRESVSKREMARLVGLWQMADWPLRQTLSGLYGNLSFFYRRNVEVEQMLEEADDVEIPGLGTPAERSMRWKAAAERCAGKALDATGMTAEETMFLPANFAPDFFFLLHWNLAAAKYLQGKKQECRLYLRNCLKIRPHDAELVDIQRDAVKMYEELGA